MDTKVIESLIGMLDGSNLTLIEIEEEGVRIRMEKQPAVITQVISDAGAAAPAAAKFEVAIGSEKPAQVVGGEELSEIVSPVVGTFHSAASVGREEVSAGTVLRKGDVVCVLEAMKLMNEVLMQEDGEIVHVHANDGDMIEYGQVLFKYRQA